MCVFRKRQLCDSKRQMCVSQDKYVVSQKQMCVYKKQMCVLTFESKKPVRSPFLLFVTFALAFAATKSNCVFYKKANVYF